MTAKKPRRLGKLGDVAHDIQQADEATLVEHVGKTVIVPPEVGEKRHTSPGAAAHEPWSRLDDARADAKPS